jgi:hypothetical protein
VRPHNNEPDRNVAPDASTLTSIASVIAALCTVTFILKLPLSEWLVVTTSSCLLLISLPISVTVVAALVVGAWVSCRVAI